jgi:transcription antitermination factor NusG
VTQMAKLGLNDASEFRPPDLSPIFGEGPQWYAVHVCIKSELQVAALLRQKGIETFLPSYSEVRLWSDRKKTVIVPLISGYVFIKVILSGRAKLHTLETPGVRSFVSFAGASPAIPEDQILHLRKLTENNVHGEAFQGSFTHGQRVRIRSGSLIGLEGTLTTTPSGSSLAMYIDSIRYTLRIAVDGCDLEAI